MEVKNYLTHIAKMLCETMSDCELSEIDRVMYAKGISDALMCYAEQLPEHMTEYRIIGGDRSAAEQIKKELKVTCI